MSRKAVQRPRWSSWPVVWVPSAAVIFTLAFGAERQAVAGPEKAQGAAGSRSGSGISANGTCPSVETISAAVAALVPRGGVEALPQSAQIDVSDLGDTYRVTVKAKGSERFRVYRDVSRDCDQRARFVAVFIVLTLMPPELLLESLSKVAPPPPPPPPPVAVLPERPPPELRIELAAVLDVAPAVSDAPATTSLGGELRFSTHKGRIGGTVAAGLQPVATFTVGGLRGQETRVPFDIGIRAGRSRGPVDFGAEVGLAGALFHAEGVDTIVSASGTRLDLGGRAGVSLRFGRSRTRFAPVIGAHAVYFPKPYEIVTSPGGVLGHTPSLWLGATLGISASF